MSTLISDHQASGRFVTVNGVKAFVREEGSGEPVLCIHGVPSSSFLYRKVLPGLAKSGYKGISFDLPGMGLSDRPEQFDYSWSGLGAWTTELAEALGLTNYHLILHDIGGPVGFELLSNHLPRISSLTILNTLLVGVADFQKPWMMRPFEKKGLGRLYLTTLTPFSLRILMRMSGVNNMKLFGKEEAKAYVTLLKGSDRGTAFLKIMRGFEPTVEKEKKYREAVLKLDAPKQIIWGMNDPALTPEEYAFPIRDQLGISRLIETEGKHFLQEDQAEKIVSAFTAMNA